jgi:hypothetical protein
LVRLSLQYSAHEAPSLWPEHWMGPVGGGGEEQKPIPASKMGVGMGTGTGTGTGTAHRGHPVAMTQDCKLIAALKDWGLAMVAGAQRAKHWPGVVQLVDIMHR